MRESKDFRQDLYRYSTTSSTDTVLGLMGITCSLNLFVLQRPDVQKPVCFTLGQLKNSKQISQQFVYEFRNISSEILSGFTRVSFNKRFEQTDV